MKVITSYDDILIERITVWLMLMKSVISKRSFNKWLEDTYWYRNEYLMYGFCQWKRKVIDRYDFYRYLIKRTVFLNKMHSWICILFGCACILRILRVLSCHNFKSILYHTVGQNKALTDWLIGYYCSCYCRNYYCQYPFYF